MNASGRLEGQFRCKKCSFKWRLQRFHCYECTYTLIHLKDFLSGVKIGYGASAPLPHSTTTCGCNGDVCVCPGCVEIIRKAAACKHQLEETAPGPVDCPKCHHMYIDWINWPTFKRLIAQGKP